jgi:outer membrane lipoprotein-sorting protein
MKSVIPGLGLAVSVAIAGAAIAQVDTLTSVSAHLKAVNTMTADFTQTDQRGRIQAGALTLKRPGKIRFQYQKGVPILIVGDGKGLYFIDYQVKQVQRWPIGNTPLGVLLDPNRDLAQHAKIIPSDNARTILAEVRDRKHPEYGVITLAFSKAESAPAGLMLHGWVALDSQNNKTTIRLSNQRFNASISDQAFNWRDPRSKIPGR